MSSGTSLFTMFSKLLPTPLRVVEQDTAFDINTLYESFETAIRRFSQVMHELNEKTDKATVKHIALQKQSTYVKEREATVAAISELSREVFERGDRLVQEGGGSKGAGPQVFGEAQLLFTSANSLPAILNCLIPLIFSPCYLLMIQLV